MWAYSKFRNEVVVGIEMLNMATTAKTIRKDSNLLSLGLCLVSCVLCLAQLTNTAIATTYYCDPNGNNNNDGSADHPWGTLESVFAAGKFKYPFTSDKVQPGDTVKLNAGYHGFPYIYSGPTNLRYNEYVTIEPNGTAVVECNYIYIKEASYYRIKGLRVSPTFGGSYVSQSSIIRIFDATHITIEDCTLFTTTDDVTDDWNDTDWMYKSWSGISPGYSDNLIFRHNTVRNVFCGIVSDANCLVEKNLVERFTADAIRIGGPNSIIQDNRILDVYKHSETALHSDAIQLYGSSGINMIIRRNYICGRTDPNRNINSVGSLQGIFLEADMNDSLIENNVVLALNAVWGIGMWNANNTIIANNTILRPYGIGDWPSIKINYTSSTNSIVRNNIANGFPSGTGITSDHNFDITNFDPNVEFADYRNGDLRLAAGSHFINAGSDANAPISDILGHSRSFPPDAGCYEYAGTTPAPSPGNNSPNADAGGNKILTDTDDNGSEQVTLDGSGSNDSDGTIVRYEWTIDGNETDKITSVNPTVTRTLSIGRHTITLKVTDNDGLTDTDTVTIIVELEVGLRKYFKFNESSGTLAGDSSGIGDAGHLINGPLWTAQGEIAFDGNNDTVEITTSDLDVNKGTIALWAYPDGFSKSKHSLFGHVLSQGNRIQLYCNAAGSLNVALGSNTASSTNIQNLNPHEWYHIALVWDQGNYRVFVDGVTRTVGTYSGLSSLAAYADIGNSGNRSARTEGFDGIIDEVRLYNKPLSAAEISDLALVFLPIGDKATAEGEEISFSVRTKSGSIADITDINLPSSPIFTSNLFRWTPGYNDSGVYEVNFTAPHGGNVDFETITVTVTDSQQEGPVGYWRLDDFIGDIAYDSSTYSNDGILLNGLTWDSGRINGALSFSVPNDAVDIQTDAFNPHSGTIMMWVYPQKQTLSRHYLFGHAGNGLTDRLQLYLKYGNLCLGLGDSHETRMNIQQLHRDQWYHVALTWSNAAYSVYVNGLLMASGTYSGLSAFSPNADIGNNGITRDKAFNGKIDEVRVYNRALNAIEIAQLQLSN